MNIGGSTFNAFAVTLVVLMTAAACAPAAAPPSAPAPAPAAAPAPAPPASAAPAAPSAPAPAAPVPVAPVPAASAPTPKPAPVVALPKRGGSVTLPRDNITKGSDPHATQSAGKAVWAQSSDYLIAIDSQTFTLQPSLLESWAVSPDGLTFTLNIRKGVRWQNLPPVNGREFIADDVVYNLNRIAGKFPIAGQVFWRASDLKDIRDVVAVDKYTAKVTLKQPSVAFLGALANVLSPVVPKELVEKCGGVLADTLNCTVGTGPFILKRFDDGVLATWERNPDYWKKGEDGQPLPYLDQVKWVWFNDVGTAVAATVAGKIAFYDRAGVPELKALTRAQSRVRLTPYDRTNVWAAYLNMSKPPFNDLRVRTAIDLVMERRKSLDNVQGDAPWKWSAFLGRGYGDFALPEEEVKNRPGFRDDKTEDVKTARRLLGEAGYGLNNMLKFKVYASASSTCGRDCPTLIADQVNTHLKDIAQVTIAPVPITERAKRETDGDFEFMFHPTAAESDPGNMLLAYYHSKGARNASRYTNAELDRLVEEQDRTFDREKRKQLLWQAQRLALDERPILVWGNPWAIEVMQPNLVGWTPGGDIAGGDIFYNLSKVWLSDFPRPDKWPIVDK